MKDLAEILEHIGKLGYNKAFEIRGQKLIADSAQLDVDDVSIVDTQFVDTGTDPGDDVTVYLLETSAGAKGFLLIPDNQHADPDKAHFLDRLLESRHQKHNG